MTDVLSFKSEYRCYVLDRELIHVSCYDGDDAAGIDIDIVRQAINEFREQPRAYALDFGMTEELGTVLIEFNDGYGLGAYDISAEHYCQIIAARWQELIGG